LTRPRARNVVEATRHLLAVQAQDPRGARLAVRARTNGAHASDVDRALTDERSLVVTWANRGTLHLIAAEDEPLLHALTTPQLRTGSERRLRQEGVSAAAAERGVAAIIKALGENGPMTRSALRAVVERARVPTAGQALVHVLFRATLDGLIVRGPMIGREQAFVLVADWLGERPANHRDRDSALAELARRYLAGHGPADDRDLAKWAQITLRDARAGLSMIASELDQRPDGLVDVRRRGGAKPEGSSPRLLGAFEPLLLGWCSRAFVLDAARRDTVLAGGVFKPIVLVGGRVAGTWAMPGGRVALDMWREPDRSTAAALRRDSDAVRAYLST
jgi:hypothetical protein